MNVPKFKTIQPHRSMDEMLHLVNQNEAVRQSLTLKALREMEQEQPVRLQETETGILVITDGRARRLRIAPDNVIAMNALTDVFPDLIRKWARARR